MIFVNDILEGKMEKIKYCVVLALAIASISNNGDIVTPSLSLSKSLQIFFLYNFFNSIDIKTGFAFSDLLYCSKYLTL